MTPGVTPARRRRTAGALAAGVSVAAGGLVAAGVTPVLGPLLIIQGGADTTIPPVSSQLLAPHLCSVGQDTERWVHPGMTHTALITVSVGDMAY